MVGKRCAKMNFIKEHAIRESKKLSNSWLAQTADRQFVRFANCKFQYVIKQ